MLAQVVQSPQPNITVTVTPGGILLSGDDPETLDKVEELIRMLSDEAVLGRTEFKVYYLTHSTASVVSSSLQSLMGTTTPGLGASGIASVDLPEWQNAELMGWVGTQGNAIEKTGVVTVSIDERLNALYIQANPVDHRTIEKLIDILDQPSRDDIMNRATPRFLPIQYMQVADARVAVEQAFASRMQGSRGQQTGGVAIQLPGGVTRGGPQGQQGMEGIQQVIEAMRQGRGGQGTPREQEPPMTLSVYDNVLIVTSTEATFLEVKAFVEDLDLKASQRTIVREQVQLRYTTPAVAQGTLANLLGPAATFTSNRAVPQQTQFGGGGTFGGGTMGGTRPTGTTTGGSPFGGTSTFGAGNPFMNMMRGGTTGTTGGTIGGGTFGRPTGTTTRGGTFGGTQRPTGTTGGGR
jgi:type II secretory pathway component GspD/PulD (secretin)